MRRLGQVFHCRLLLIVAFIATHLCSQSTSQPFTSTSSPRNMQVPVCDFKTINYITHTLPQQCLKTSWPGDKAATDGTAHPYDAAYRHHNRTTDAATGQTTPTSDAATKITKVHTPTAFLRDTSGEEEPSPRPFMSFEDWKEMMLRKAGQDPSELKSRKSQDRAAESERATKAVGLDSLGDDGEIDLNFDVVSEKISNIASAPEDATTELSAADHHQEPVLYDDGRTQYYRSKDAGKTCKERFSYSSFDAGATVLKTNKGAKNAKAILVENKDSYMLLECSAASKFVIVELSDDILVDTIVLANFEFFSSMIRQFRVSVSDRYPVRADKWRELGTFEAKNSRDIQPFLVPNPLIWAKYVRIEFLSQYGNEYYCPVSLLRVHGTRMLESWKETETPVDEDDTADEPFGELPGPSTNIDSIDSAQEQENTLHPPTGESQAASLDFSINPLQLHNLFWRLDEDNTACSKSTTLVTAENPKSIPPSDAKGANPLFSDKTLANSRSGSGMLDGQLSENESASMASAAPSQSETSAASTAVASASTAGHQSHVQPDLRSAGEEATAHSNPTKPTPQVNAQSRMKGNSTAAPASPTVQESFFKAVSKRLQLLEANVTLSLKYIEDQSRSLQETQHSAERKQLSRIDFFLDSLNHTVLSELRSVRQQYDQIWQSTVIALESQREQSQRETVALSSRLNILADEVVFQKRMAIVQAILLLSCLVLVIFSRAMTQPMLMNSWDIGRSPNVNHPLPGVPTTQDSGRAFTSRYDQFGRPFDTAECDDIDQSDSQPRMLTPYSDVVQSPYIHEDSKSPYIHEDSKCGSASVRTPELLPDDCLVANKPDGGNLSPLCRATLSPDDGEFVTNGGTLPDHDCHVPSSYQSTRALAESPSITEPDVRFPPQTRGIASCTIRKPLPALPEYPL